MENLLEKINAVGNLKSAAFIKLDALEMGVKYPITEIQRKTTKFGVKILVDLDDKGSVYLPDRFTKVMTETTIRSLNKQKLNLIYNGTKDTGKANPAHLVEIVE